MDKISQQIKSGKIFVYPTDTIYGLGCNAEDEKAVQKIKNLKKRDKDKPLSVIAPSIEWIKQNCIVDVDLEKYLPGPYTIILKKNNPEFLKHISSTDSIGVRIPDNDFTLKVQGAEKPFITTSVNLEGQAFATKVLEVPKEILDCVDVIVDVGELSGRPSTLIINGKEIKR
ncbi:L-threonylcarbamoyladenylate synthase [Nanoarchaeota archaeon]